MNEDVVSNTNSITQILLLPTSLRELFILADTIRILQLFQLSGIHNNTAIPNGIEFDFRSNRSDNSRSSIHSTTSVQNQLTYTDPRTRRIHPKKTFRKKGKKYIKTNIQKRQFYGQPYKKCQNNK